MKEHRAQEHPGAETDDHLEGRFRPGADRGKPPAEKCDDEDEQQK
jgi:hypothetical protein